MHRRCQQQHHHHQQLQQQQHHYHHQQSAIVSQSASISSSSSTTGDCSPVTSHMRMCVLPGTYHYTRGPVVWRASLRNTIYDVLRARPGWVETEHATDWHFNWADRGWIHAELDKLHLADHQRINHFPNHQELTRKDLLIKNLKRAKRQLEREGRAAEAEAYAFFPTTFVLPREYRMFVEEFRRSGGTWIMKAQGRGIFLFTKLAQISDWRRSYTAGEAAATSGCSSPSAAAAVAGSGGSTAGCWGQQQQQQQQQAETYLAQRYVDRPYLVGGRKFDMRIYVLVTSYNPLRVYLYRSGFARFTNARFSMRHDDIGNSFIHLTNVAIQKHAPGFDRDRGMKWPLRSLRLFLTTRHGAGAANALFGSIQALLIRALLAVAPNMINDKHSFELYGYDVLIDADLKPWLLEVNSSPSLTASDQADWTLKSGMLNDMLDVLDLEGVRQPGSAPPSTQGGFDLIWDGGPMARPFDQCGQPTSLPSLLGAFNPADANQARQPHPDHAAQQQLLQEPRGCGGRAARLDSSRSQQQLHKTGSSSSSCGAGSSGRGGAVGVEAQ